ncbi:MAG: ABC transporter permease [Desulfovibrio sp.]|jgi:NitT/TauT family transport system permease protein|nr:ABC transporter permease [Desulfovibrio sp.]
MPDILDRCADAAQTGAGTLPPFVGNDPERPAEVTASLYRSGKRRRSRLVVSLYGFSLFIAGFAAWAAVAWVLPAKHRYLFPSPWLTLRMLWESIPELLVGTGSSFLILAPAYCGAVILGAVWGLLVGSSERLRMIFIPFARVVAPVPPTVYIPYAIALLPTFRSSAIFIVLLAAFWPVFMNAAAGSLAVPEQYRDNAGILGFTRLEYLCRVAFPSALPHIFNGMHVGLGMAFIMLTVAELFGSTSGLGRFVQYYADYADFPRMLAGILYTGLITFLSMSGLGILERKVVFWPH